jgi:hypothetical protein
MTEKRSDILTALATRLAMVSLCGVFRVSHPPYTMPQVRATPLKNVTVGDHVVLPGYSWTTSKFTLLLGLHVDCVHCEADMPFYRRLFSLERTGGTKVHIIAAYPDPRDQVTEDILRYLGKVPFWPSVSSDALRIRATPTLLMIDQTGTVRHVWVGELSEAQEEVINNMPVGTL